MMMCYSQNQICATSSLQHSLTGLPEDKTFTGEDLLMYLYVNAIGQGWRAICKQNV